MPSSSAATGARRPGVSAASPRRRGCPSRPALWASTGCSRSRAYPSRAGTRPLTCVRAVVVDLDPFDAGERRRPAAGQAGRRQRREALAAPGRRRPSSRSRARLRRCGSSSPHDPAIASVGRATHRVLERLAGRPLAHAALAGSPATVSWSASAAQPMKGVRWADRAWRLRRLLVHVVEAPTAQHDAARASRVSAGAAGTGKNSISAAGAVATRIASGASGSGVIARCWPAAEPVRPGGLPGRRRGSLGCVGLGT